MSVVALHKPRPCEEVPATLRRIADEIDSGEYDWPITTAVLILGHTDAELPNGDGDLTQRNYWETYGMGPRADVFTVRGLLMPVLARWSHSNE